MAKDAAVSDISQVSADKTAATATQGGEALDFEALFKEQQAELESTKEHLGKTSKEFESLKGEHSKTSETIAKLKSAFVPEVEQSAFDKEMASLEAEEMEWYEQALEAERKGKTMPLTIRNGLSNIKYRRDFLTKMKAIEDENKLLKEKVEKASDPRAATAQMVYDHLDSQIESHLTKIFGEGDETSPVRQAQFQAIANQIGAELKHQRETNPDVYNQIMKNKANQDKMVAYYVNKNIPPKARQLMEEDRIRKEPVPTSEVLAAYREAKQKGNTQEAAKLRTELFSRLGDKSMKLRVNEILPV
jgi:hypothetical protein